MKYYTRNTLSLLVLAFSVTVASDAFAKKPVFTQTFDDIELNILDEEAKACSVLVNCISYGD